MDLLKQALLPGEPAGSLHSTSAQWARECLEVLTAALQRRSGTLPGRRKMAEDFCYPSAFINLKCRIESLSLWVLVMIFGLCCTSTKRFACFD